MGSGGQSNTDSSTANMTTTVTSFYKPTYKQQEATAAPVSTQSTSFSLRWWVGLVQASCFSLVYIFSPFYILSGLVGLCYYQVVYGPWWFWVYITPLLVSAVLPPAASPFVLQLLKPMLEYFDSYEQIVEVSPIDVVEKSTVQGQNYILAFQPHGVVPYTSILSVVAAPSRYQATIPTGVADAVLYTPILKHVMGIFNLISASKKSLVRTLTQNKGLKGSVVLYVGGMAELFLSSEKEERLYLKKRKGFIKLSLQTGVDIIPVYLFGNTTVLSVVKHGVLAALSRKLQVSLTYLWGKWYLPIPRNNCKLLYVSGQPVGIPHIPNPTQADIDKYHAQYCQQVERLFQKYKEKVPEYKHKVLHIM